jgi:hypothetical protein
VARLKLSSFDPVNWVLIVRDATGAHVSGMGSRGGLEYAKGLASSMLRVDQAGGTGTYSTVEIYPFQKDVPWQELQALKTVSLDDEGVEDGL